VNVESAVEPEKGESEMNNPILEALGIANLLPNTAFPGLEAEVLKKILADNFLTLRCQELMIRHFAVEAIQQMHPVERAALLKRISPTPKPATKVIWAAEEGHASGKPILSASCEGCRQTVYFGIPEVKQAGAKYVYPTPADVDRAIENLRWSHCGRTDTPSVYFIERYREIAMKNVQE
jgi:hypothetical protein